MAAAPGAVHPLVPLQPIEIAHAGLCASMRKPMIAEQSTSPTKGKLPAGNRAQIFEMPHGWTVVF
jgi:hypothetical protein